MTNICETFQISLSALLDSELEMAEVVPTFDHLLGCGECRSFYLQARALEEKITSEPAVKGASQSAHLEELWVRIRNESLRRERWRRARARLPQAAAILFVMVGSLFVYDRWPAPTPDGGDSEIVVGENRGQMTPNRFLEITSELLRADRRFHREMLQVMAVVAEERGAGEVSRTQREGSESFGPDPEVDGAQPQVQRRDL